MKTIHSALLLAAHGIAATLGAQDLIPSSAPKNLRTERTPIHTMAPDEGLVYGLWAAGDDYKVSFHDGATFVPYLGKDYPRTQSLRWQTTSARLGERELCTQAPQLAHTQYRAEYDLGGIIEAYDVLSNGLEQTFVLKQRPAAIGDLVITGAIDTQLQALPGAPAHREVVFVDDLGNRILAYGAATAIDAHGRSVAMTTTAAAGTIALHLDGNWLASATFPVVIDPLLNPFLTSAGQDITDMDLAREHALNHGNLWFAVSRSVSATDTDLWLRRYDDDGSNGMTNFTDLAGGWSSSEASLGMHFFSGNCLLAFTREFPTGTRRIRYHLHSRNDNLLQTHVNNLGDNTINAWRADVASDLHPLAPNSLLVVYQSEGTGAPFVDLQNSSISAAEVVLTGTGTASAPFAVASSLALDQERPSIAKVQLGSAQVWTVAYQVIDSGLVASGGHPTWDIIIQRVDRNGNVGGAQSSLTSNGFHRMAPRIAGFNNKHVLIYVASTAASAGAKPLGNNGHGIYSRRIDWTGSAFQVSPTQSLQINNDARLVLTGFDVDRNSLDFYALTFRSTVTQNAYLRLLGYRGHQTADEALFVPSGNQTTGSGAVTFDETADQFVIGFERNTPMVSSDARLVRYAFPAAPAPVSVGIGCGTGTLSWQGSQRIGGEQSSVGIFNVPSGALAAIAVATTPFAQPLIGVPNVHSGCWLLVPNTGAGHLGFLPLGVGPQAAWPLDLPEWLPNMTLYFQGFHFDAGNTEVFTTQRLEVPIVK